VENIDGLVAVIEVIREIGGLSNTLQEDQDIYESGVTSVQALPLLMELEARFNVTIPDDRFISARSPRDLYAVIKEVKGA
jgi:acyl carrier protein